ncbi:hypothetical protein EJ07DRAFT_130015 [Lizonia empirigonia]|nr:hypothetical protein EJ07DRAFT_130015 [Lizonia empirigonia]
MPTYHARSITVRLGSMPLAETTTSEVVLKKGEVAKRQSEAAEEKLMHSFLLDEERVLFPGDPDGYELNWLGNAPFMQVRAVAGFTEPSAPYVSPQKSSTPQDRRPQALALHVNLSAKAFMSGFSGKTHLKIDVLFNGQLSACSLVHTNDIRSGAKSLHQVFAGYRVDFLAERPWVILPPYTNADGGERRFRKTITSTQRWEQICASLQIEAKERGTNKDGEAPPSAEFMDALSTMQMPEIVKNMHKPGGRKFGVVDVIITAGVGSKLTTGANYLKTPQRLRDPNYTVRNETIPKNKASTADDGHKEPLPSKDGHQASGKTCKISDPQGYSSDASRIFQEYHSPLPNVQPSALHASPMHSTPVSMPFSTPRVRHEVFDDPPFVTSTSGSSPMMHTFGSYNTTLIGSSLTGGTIALVNRLVITGLGGRPIVDHCWKIAQRIVVNHGRSDESFTGYREGTPGSAFGKPRARSRVRKQSASCTSTFRANSPPKANKESQPHIAEPSMYGERRDSAQDGQTKQAIKSIITSTMMPTLVHTPTSASSAQSTIIQRRTCSRNAWPGIQGPKATTFLLDDPEEVLREAARTRRSRSPTKPATTLSVPAIHWPAQVDSLTNQAIPGDSSPLSSVPSSPLPEGTPGATRTAGPAIDKNTQLDGSSEHTVPSTSSRKMQTQSPTKSSFCTPKFRHQGPAAPQTSVLPDSKKRKAAPRSYTKPPRSPGRLMTVDNPALNDDCVIAFAESRDKDAERGVLRQVKGEKQGVFKEEYVVLAVRFFIPGD